MDREGEKEKEEKKPLLSGIYFIAYLFNFNALIYLVYVKLFIIKLLIKYNHSNYNIYFW